MASGTTPPSPEAARISYWHLFRLLLLLSFFHRFATPFPAVADAAAVASSAVLGNLWETGGTNAVNCTDGSLVSPILTNGASGPSFAAGFICGSTPCDGVLFAVFLVRHTSSGTIAPSTAPQVVWTANRNDPISGSYASLSLTADGDLRLSDQHGRSVWSTNTSGRGVASLNLMVNGNLVLLDGRNRSIWESYGHPTDTALFNQSLTGMNLVANASATNSSEGPYYLSARDTSYSAYIRDLAAAGGIPSVQMYYKSDESLSQGVLLPAPSASDLLLDQLPPPLNRTGPPSFDPSIFALEFVRLEADGRLREYKWQVGSSQWEPKDEELMRDNRRGCKYPTECNRYGVCDSDQDCSCPGEEDNNVEHYFELVNPTKHKEGCRPLKPWSCGGGGLPPRLVLYKDIGYFGYVQAANISNTDVQSCKQACLSRNCSCSAAFFRYNGTFSDVDHHKDSQLVRGDCYLPSTLYSLIRISEFESNVSSLAFIKVLDAAESGGGSSCFAVEISVPIVCFLIILVVGSGLLIRRQRLLRAKSLDDRAAGGEEADRRDVELYRFDHLPGMPTRFSFDELEEATGGFTKKLGEGGFGAVFLGTLRNSSQVAVKILGYRGQGMKEFLAEVETIGSIHHLNLVRLVGYCAEGLHRMLVYEYLVNNSLDKWIFINNDEKNSTGCVVASTSSSKLTPRLDFATKYKIILHIARGLSYLHDDCRHKIIHLDIKPQNILLDATFNAKVSDFGLSKLVDRDQSQVVTTLRGTLGYLAPEWANSVITEKVDVYSFGVVVLETVSGKKILDNSRSLGSANLVMLLSKAAEEKRLADIINIEDDVDVEKAMRLVKVATWCLQTDYNDRPSMSTVIKVLEGFMEVDPVPLGPWISPWATTMSMTTTMRASGSSMATSPPLWSDMARPR